RARARVVAARAAAVAQGVARRARRGGRAAARLGPGRCVKFRQTPRGPRRPVATFSIRWPNPPSPWPLVPNGARALHASAVLGFRAARWRTARSRATDSGDAPHSRTGRPAEPRAAFTSATDTVP